MVRHQPAFALAVADLLAPVRLYRCTVVMPDERGGRKADSPAASLQSPAHVDIVAGAEIDRIEAADRDERLAPERHVAARDVLGDPIVQQDVRRAAGSAGDALRHGRVVRGHHVGAARSDDIRREERLHEEGQPVAVRAGVGVRVGDDFTRGLGEADVPRRAQAAVRDVHDANAGVLAGDLARRVPGTVVDDDDFVVGIGLALESREAVLDRIRRVVRADDHRDARPVAPALGRERHLGKRRGHGRGRRLRAAGTIDQAEGPVVDRMAAAPPFIGPRERHRAGGTFLEGGADVHRGDLGLARHALSDAVGARLGEQERLLPGDVLQPGEIRAQLRFAMQVDIEGADVQERQVEKFGRREVHIREQCIRHRILGALEQRAEKPLDTQAPVPADDSGWDLVAQREQGDRGMFPELANLGDDLFRDGSVRGAIVEKRHVLHPGDAHHHTQPVAAGLVEQLQPRGRVEADGIDAEGCHLPEVLGDLMG